jgi:hypothetical protein
VSASRDEILETTADLRCQAWGRFGAVDDQVLSHLVNPAFMGGPRWPALRQAYRVARGQRGLLLASDGLSDPFDEGGPQELSGFELELYAISSDEVSVPGSWLWDMVWQMSNFAAGHGGIRELLDELGLISTELYDVSIPEASADRFVNQEGRVGVMLGLEDAVVPKVIDSPLTAIRLVNVKLLTLDELDYVVRGGESARTELGSALVAQGDVTSSSLQRRSAI